MTFEQAIKDMQNKKIKAMTEAVIIIEADAKLNCPVLSGTLRRSITHDVTQEGNTTIGVVGSNVEYAYWAERKKPYLQPALDSNLESIKRRIEEVLNA